MSEDNRTNYRTRLPSSLYLELDKGATEPFTGRMISKEEEAINVGPKNSPIIRAMVIDYESISDWLPERKLNYFDLLVHDAIWTLYANGITVFTVSTVTKVISGKPTLNPSKKQEESVRDSIARLLSTSVKIAFSQECEKYQNMGINSRETYYEGHLVSGEIITERINNRYSDAVVRIFRKPILGELADMKNQVTTVSNRLLSVPVKLDVNTYILRDYLLRKIFRKDRRKKNSERVIIFETLWKYLSISNDEYMVKKRTVEKIETILSYWKKENLIISYKISAGKIIIVPTL